MNQRNSKRSSRRPQAAAARRPRCQAAGRCAGDSSLCDTHGIPALVTYKAKGVVPDDHPWFGGDLDQRRDRAAADRRERSVDRRRARSRRVAAASVEVAGNRWSPARRGVRNAACAVCRAATLGRWPRPSAKSAAWSEVLRLAAGRACAGYRPSNAAGSRSTRDGLTAQRVVERAARCCWPTRARHRRRRRAHVRRDVALAGQRAERTVDLERAVDDGLRACRRRSARRLLDRARPVVALTGDGGLLMCAGRTADGGACDAAGHHDRLQRRLAEPDRDQAAGAAS